MISGEEYRAIISDDLEALSVYACVCIVFERE
jgi:hypothetical protein